MVGTPNKSVKQALKLALIFPAMFCFAFFVLPPMYDALCDITGLNGKVSQAEFDSSIPEANVSEAAPADSTSQSTKSTNDNETSGTTEGLTRRVKIQFLTDVESAMPWHLEPSVPSMEIELGKRYEVMFNAENYSDLDLIGRAIPSITPSQGASYIKKFECFCFQKQPLAAGEKKAMAMSFYIDKELPETLNTITLSYKLYRLESES